MTARFPLLPVAIKRDDVLAEAALLCNVDPSRVEDIFPCTPTQEELLTLASTSDYLSRYVLELQSTVDISRLQAAVEAVVAATPILRAQIVHLPSQGFVHVVVDKPVTWTRKNNLQEYLTTDEQVVTEMGATSFSQYGFVEQSENGTSVFIWILTLHRVLYDSFSVAMLLHAIEEVYIKQEQIMLEPFQSFVKHIANLDVESAAAFWEAQLSNSKAALFPPLPSPTYQPRVDSTLEHFIGGLNVCMDNITASTAVRTAWTILSARYTDSAEVIFGATVTGRQATISRVELTAGSTLAIVPVRVAIDWQKSVGELLQQIQSQTLEMAPFEQLGMQQLRRVSAGGEQGSQFQVLIVVQSVEEDIEERSSTLFASQSDHQTGGPQYAMVVTCQLKAQGLQLSIQFDSSVVDGTQVQRITQQLEQVLRQVCLAGNSATKLSELETTSAQDLQDIWSWNATVPESVNRCVHDVIAEKTSLQPNAPAVCAWDGDLTYAELDKLSTQLAHRLVTHGVRPGAVVPLCFEKSMWTPVAMLAVMKAGGASVALDVAQPLLRLKTIVKQSSRELILCSKENEEIARSLDSVAVLKVDKSSLASDTAQVRLPQVSPSHIVFVTYTSGSTGVPKGACISHANVCTASHYQGLKLGFRVTSRVLDFAPYSFDVAWSNVLQTLCAGGCLCIAPSSDMLNNIDETISRFRVTLINLTPSALRAITPKRSSLEDILLSGERPDTNLLSKWVDKVHLRNTYGPAECTWKSAFATVSSINLRNPDIGRTLGVRSWIVHPERHNSLVSIGQVGELLLEGPLVGQGYLGGDVEKTAKAFIKDPAWLLKGGPEVPGRCGRLYKTGDLVRYNANGTLQFMGRKDAQIKIRGQRVELGEVEHYVQEHLATREDNLLSVAEVITLQASETPILVVFIAIPKTESFETTIREVTSGLDNKLTATLPIYMIPSVYIPISQLPMTGTGKIDRKELRRFGSTFSLEQLLALDASYSNSKRQPPTTEAERLLQQLWASLLGISTSSISANDSFLRIGGDSIKAMHMIGALREQGWLLTVANIFQHPQLCDLALMLTQLDKDTFSNIQPILPFSLLPPSLKKNWTRQQAALLCNITITEVADVFPCTPLQEGLLAMTTANSGDYIGQKTFELSHGVNVEHFKATWAKVIQMVPILRTRIIDLPGQGLMQVVVDSQINQPLNILKAPREQCSMGLGLPLCYADLIAHKKGQFSFILTMHHAIYDGWSTPLLIKAIDNTYQNSTVNNINMLPLQEFVRYTLSIDRTLATKFWQTQLAGSEAAQFPILPTPTYRPHTNTIIDREIKDLVWAGHNFTATTAVRAAWAILQSKYTSAAEAVFGAIVTGRQAPVPGVERVIGPTIATVPIRIILDNDATLEQLLGQIQSQAIAMISYEQTGLQYIRQINQEASQFQTLLVVHAKQPKQLADEACILHESSSTTIEGFGSGYEASMTYGLVINLFLEKDAAFIRISYDSGVVHPAEAKRILGNFENVLRQILKPASTQVKLKDLNLISDNDLRDIWTWNKTIYKAIDSTIDNMIAETTLRQPTAPAVCAWDGNLTYSELDKLSTQLAYRLMDLGVGPNVIVPLCFEKSKWMAVAILGVIKTGGASVALDVTLTEDRLRQIIHQVKAKIIVSSSTSQSLAGRLGDSITVVTADATYLPQPHRTLPIVTPSDMLYIVFTSGSTGTPKGAVVTHGNFASALTYQQNALGFRNTSRVFDFVSYAFDVVWSNYLHTLYAGGCICIPSEAERHSNIAQSMRNLNVNFADLTPTVARLLEPSELPGLKTLLLSGEAIKATDAARWGKSVPLILNTYGPAETTVKTTVGVIQHDSDQEPTIGQGYGGNTWLVDPLDYTRLVPIGCVGELVFDGPLVIKGYFNNEVQTKAVFIEDPPWLLRGTEGFLGRQGRLYRTGDLVRYRPDGMLEFIGRRDDQVKIRGQRIELGEIEHHIRRLLVSENLESASPKPEVISKVVKLSNSKELYVVPEVVKLSGSNSTTLVAFIVPPQAATTLTEADVARLVNQMVHGVNDKLSNIVPGAMIPTAYIPLATLPMTSTGKTDRKTLRQIGSKFSLEQLLALNASHNENKRRPPTTEAERLLQQLWASILGINAGNIGLDDSFLRIGGDSIGAMRLIGALREQGFLLTFANIFQHPRLGELAKDITIDDTRAKKAIAPLTLLQAGIDLDEARRQAAALCGVEESEIEDVFPCTPLQEGLLAMTAKRAGDYVSRTVLELRSTVDITLFQAAVEAVVAKVPILRTQVIDLPRQGLVQVVNKRSTQWVTNNNLQAYLSADKQKPTGLGTPLSRFGIVNEEKGGKRFFIWTLHHSLYDGWSMPLLFKELKMVYQGQQSTTLPPFQAFVKHILDIDESNLASFWQTQLAGSEAVPFPLLPSPAYQPLAGSSIEHHITGLQWHVGDITASTMIRAAWAVLAARYTGVSEAVFGVTLTGRHAAVAGVERMMGPTIATVPVRVVLDWGNSVDEVLQHVQDQAIEMTPFEQVGLQRIRRVSAAAERGSHFQTLLMIQPAETRTIEEANVLFEPQVDEEENNGVDKFNTYAMMLVCQLESDGLQLHISFDATITKSKQVRRMAWQLEHVLRQMCALHNGAKRLAEIDIASKQDLQDIWNWNATVPETVHRCVHSLIADTTSRQPDAPAVCAWDGELTYAELDELSTRLAYHLVGHGVGPNVIVPLLFEKSMWTPVAMLAVMKAGGASVLLEIEQPEERLQTIIQQVAPILILSSVANEGLAGHHGSTVIVVDKSHLIRSGLESKAELPEVKPSDKLYVVFTSGSTGTPKGVVITHANFSSALFHQNEALGFSRTSRVYDSVSYAFDVAWSNALHTLYAGGCLCVPSQQDRRSNLERSMRELKVNYADLTPTLARVIDPAEVPDLRHINFGGESLTASDIRKWRSATALINAYGPAECTVTTTLASVRSDMTSEPGIGRGIGTNTWVVDTTDNGRLVPVGCTGELLIEGPLVGQGYLGDAEKTAVAFTEDPAWLLNGGPGVPGRRGQLYKTGDLVQYNSNGTLQFVGRKDAQIKIRGQRVELGEIEYYVQKYLATAQSMISVAEVIIPKASENAMLVVFIAVPGLAAKSLEVIVREATLGLDDKLAAALPAYMVPSAYIPVDQIPITTNGKTDRQQLRQIGSTLLLEQLLALNPLRSEWRPATTKEEKLLQQLWASLLGIDAATIGADDSFLRIGGDSIGAMRLVASARQAGFAITIANILQKPRLYDLALTLVQLDKTTSEAESILPFSLLGSSVQIRRVQEQAALLCGIAPTEVADVFSCTPLQEGLLAMTAVESGNYIGQTIFEIAQGVDAKHFETTWACVVKTFPILRTRIIDLPQHGLMQVVVDSQTHYTLNITSDTPKAQYNIGLGTPLCYADLIADSKSGRLLFVLTMHHAIYDGWSMPLLIEAIENIYRGSIVENVLPLQKFVKYVLDIDRTLADDFWRKQLAGSEVAQFPALPAPTYRPHTNATIEQQVKGLIWTDHDFTATTALRATWAIIQAQYTSAMEAVFGTIVTGRQAPVAGVEQIVGPTIATVPIRIAVDNNATVEQLLSQIQSQAVDMIAYEQTGLQYIRQISPEAEQCCRFQTMLVVHAEQPKQSTDETLILYERDSASNQGFGNTAIASNGYEASITYALLINVFLKKDEAHVHISYDSSIVDLAEAKRISSYFEHILRQILKPACAQMKLKDMGLSNEDLQDIWSWNSIMHEATNSCVHTMIAETTSRQPNALAVCAWDGKFTYIELDQLSNQLAYRLISIGVQPQTIIPLCFEKSMWMAVAILGVMKAGCVSIALDATLAENRLCQIAQQVDAKVIISSSATQSLARRLNNSVQVVIADYTELLQSEQRHYGTDSTITLPKVAPSDMLYMVFTSGSTGVPKGAIVTHENFASAFTHQQHALGFKSTSRVFDYVSYAFDVVWSNYLHTLYAGGCICIPSEAERKGGDITQSMRNFDVNFADLTPTVARLLEPNRLPSLKTLLLSGEAIKATDAARWKSVPLILNTYGPAETTVKTTVGVIQGNSDQETNISNLGQEPSIGRGYGGNTWLVDPSDHTRLVPIGCTGELVFDGPLVIQGYYNNKTQTEAAFIKDPPWLLCGGRQGRLYRTGDLVRYRPNGMLEFIGRKDDQVKIRGQRIELGEIEHHIRRLLVLKNLESTSSELYVVPEVITLSGSNSTSLVAFIVPPQAAVATEADLAHIVNKMVQGVNETLSSIVPGAMIPTAYIPLAALPMTPTGKTDRRKLRQIGSSFSLEQLLAISPSRSEWRPPTTKTEQLLQTLWASILGIDANKIGVDDSFLRIGGDSIGAMRLIGALRDQNLSLTVADVFQNPQLGKLARLVEAGADVVTEDVLSVTPLSFIQAEDLPPFIKHVVIPQLTAAAKIVDVMPTTDFQKICIREALSDPPGRWSHFLFDLPTNVDFQRLDWACSMAVKHLEVLRMIFVTIHDSFWQVLVDSIEIGFKVYENHAYSPGFAATMCEKDLRRKRVLGQTFVRFFAVKDSVGGNKLVFRCSHAHYDGFCLSSIFEFIFGLYDGAKMATQNHGFSRFIAHASGQRLKSIVHWRSVMHGSPVFDWSQSQTSQSADGPPSQSPMTITVKIPNAGEDVTTASLFHAAFALALSKSYDTPDVLFGRLVTGRAMLPSELQETIGPCLAELPVRVKVQAGDTLRSVAVRLQRQFIEDSQWESVGMADIIQECTDWPVVVNDFGWRATFQPEFESTSLSRLKYAQSTYEGLTVPRERPELYARKIGEDLELSYESDGCTISQEMVRFVLTTMQSILKE